MADVKKMATRDGYGKALVELGREHDDVVVLDADLAGSTKTGMFAKAYPDRHFNCGIAEGNMMSVAAGLAAAGLTPFYPRQVYLPGLQESGQTKGSYFPLSSC